MLTEKRCFKCSITKPISEFYPHKQMLDGHLNKCKECAKKDVTEKYNINKQDNDYVEKERARGREKFHRLYAGVKSNDSGFERTRRYRNKYPEKKNATHAVHKAKLVKPFDGAEAHHWSYNDEHFFDVIWLTIKQHNKSHRFMYYNNASFDNQFFRAFFVQNNDNYFGSWFWSSSIDVMILAAQYLMEERHRMKDFKLKTVAAQLGFIVDESKLHDATYDIELTRWIYQQVSGKEKLIKNETDLQQVQTT